MEENNFKENEERWWQQSKRSLNIQAGWSYFIQIVYHRVFCLRQVARSKQHNSRDQANSLRYMHLHNHSWSYKDNFSIRMSRVSAERLLKCAAPTVSTLLHFPSFPPPLSVLSSAYRGSGKRCLFTRRSNAASRATFQPGLCQLLPPPLVHFLALSMSEMVWFGLLETAHIWTEVTYHNSNFAVEKITYPIFQTRLTFFWGRRRWKALDI